MISELELFHKEKIDYLKQSDINEDFVVESRQLATNLTKKADLELKNMKDSIFKGKFLKFEKNKYKLCKSAVGSLSCFKNLDSLIVLDKQKQLMSLCEFTQCQKWNLIYRATQDGFEADNFHSKCDDKPNTLIIVKSVNGNIFGTYMHGPILARNPEFADLLLTRATGRKYAQITDPLALKYATWRRKVI
jgi:hypothetical protein